MTPELKPCPFCGSTDVYADRNTEETFLIQCGSCFSEGPETGSVTAAWEAWGRRASPWQPIETAPKDKMLLLWWRPKKPNELAESAVLGSIPRPDKGYGDNVWWEPMRGYYQDLWHITHWMLLPEPPEVER